MQLIGDPEIGQRPDGFPGLRPGRPWTSHRNIMAGGFGVDEAGIAGAGAPFPAPAADDTDIGGVTASSARASMASGRPWLPRFVSLVLLVLACSALPQQAAAQNSIEIPALGTTITIADTTVTEGDDNAEFMVTFEPTYSFTNDLAFGVSYIAGSAVLEDLGSNRTTEFTIETNTSSYTLEVPIEDDTLIEGEETFTVVIEIFGMMIRATGTIIDNDKAEVSIADRTVPEDAGTVGFMVSLDQAVGSDVVLDVAYAPGAPNPISLSDDLGTPLQETVMIAEGDTSATIEVSIIEDFIVEGNETFTVTLSENRDTPLPAEVIIDDGEATVTITDNDELPGQSGSISIADAAPVAESGIARFTISLDPRTLTGDALLDVAYAPGTATEGTQPAIPEADLGSDRPTTVTIPEGSRRVILEVPITDDETIEGRESFTVTLSVAAEQPDNPETGMPPTFILLFPRAEATGTITDNDVPPEVLPPVSEPSVLIEPRLVGAGAALRRHVSRFDSLTGTLVRNRLKGSGMHNLSFAADVTGDSQDVAVSSQPFTGSWGTWIDGAWAGIGGQASGRQADIYGGVDYQGADGDWLVGALIGYELADLDIGEATLRSDYVHFGIYGGAFLSEHLLFDGAFTFGRATPEVAQGNVSASYDARRLTARGALTGNSGFEYRPGIGSVRVEPQLGLLYSRETLGAFTDSAFGVAEREVLELGRSSAGPRLTWDFDGGQMAGQVTGGARVQWDFLGLDDGVGGQVSSAADIGLRFDLAPGVSVGVQGDIDGIGISDEFTSVGGNVELGVRF